MAAKEDKQWWDPYETSNKRQFVYLPNSAAEALWCPASTSFIGSYSHSGPFGSTVYNKDFCWKPACKAERIRTGIASGQRRNNPHPSQSFLMWRLPRVSHEYVSFPWQCPPSQGEIRKALTAQYRSTYRCDFMSMCQGHDHISNGERGFALKHNVREVPLSAETVMKNIHHPPKQKPELLHHSDNTDPNMASHVPTVLQGNVHTQQKSSDLRKFDRFYGKKVTCVIKSPPPQELQQLQGHYPEAEKEAVKTDLGKDAHSKEEVNKLPAVALNSCPPDWISSWPGPL